MPHECVRCGNFYEDGANEILKGCSCGGKMFFFIKKSQLKEAEEFTSNLTNEQKTEMENDVLEIMEENYEVDQPVVLDFESIKVLSPGKYHIDLVHLFKKDPLVFRYAEGKYVIDLAESFKSLNKKGK